MQFLFSFYMYYYFYPFQPYEMSLEKIWDRINLLSLA